jgi:hypothetical protein
VHYKIQPPVRGNEQMIYTQLVLGFLYPLLAAISLSLWGIYLINRTSLSISNKLKRICYILLLALCVFPGSLYLFSWFTEPCYGQGSALYNVSHPLLCGPDILLGMPWWVPILYSIDILVFIWSIRRNKDFTWEFVTFAIPLLYFFIFRIAALLLLERIQRHVSSI